jgi:hypothetical protein
MSVDEMLCLHEKISEWAEPILSGERFLHPKASNDIIPGFIVLLVFLALFFKFFLFLPPKIRLLFFLAGFTFVAGAIGTEVVGGYIENQYVLTKIGHGWFDVFGEPYLLYTLFLDFEEVLEMAGVVIFAHALFSYLRLKTKGITIIWVDSEK